MAIELDVFLPHILPDVAGCPAFTARLAIIEAAIEFCTKSGAWTETLALIPTTSGDYSYAPALPAGARALLITNVWAASSELTAKTMTEIARLIPDWQTAQGTPVYFNQENWTEFRVYPTPNAPGAAALTVRAQLAPTRAATTLPDFIADRHFQGIVSGALARLMLKPAQAWSNPPLAAYHKEEFLIACGDAKVAIFHDRVQGSLRVTPRRFQ